MEFDPLDWNPPVPERIVLNNGLVLYLLEDDEVPLVDVTIYVHAGSIYEPADLLGLARLTGQLMRHGGTVHHSPEEIDHALDLMAVDFEVYVRRHYVAMGFSVLKRDVDRGLDLFADILKNPVFDPDRVDLYKQENLEDIRRRYDRAGTVATGEFQKIVYGADSPWARLSSPETVSRVTRADLVRFHKQYFRPNNCIVTVCGDLPREEMVRKIRFALGDWEAREIDFLHVQPVAERHEMTINYVERSTSQSYLRVGHLGYRDHDPAEYAIEMMNYMLGGGGFLSRLTQELRSRQGLAYSVSSRFEPGQDLGLFEIRCNTDASKTHEALTLILQLIRGMVEEPPEPEEVARAKEARINEFVFAFDSLGRIVRQAGWLEYKGYPGGYLENWVANVQAVTPEDVHNAAQSYLHPDGLSILVVGDECQFDRPLCEFGDVNRIELE
jgi:predicted Zn-dependent peptidase